VSKVILFYTRRTLISLIITTIIRIQAISIRSHYSSSLRCCYSIYVVSNSWQKKLTEHNTIHYNTIQLIFDIALLTLPRKAQKCTFTPRLKHGADVYGGIAEHCDELA